MRLLLRLLAILLVLTTGGVFQTLAFASEGAVTCTDEEEETEKQCSDCAFDCAMCLCCPLRAAPSMPRVEVPVLAPIQEPVRSLIHESAPSGVSADIFQPPRA